MKSDALEKKYAQKKLKLIAEFVDEHGTLNDEEFGDAVEQRDVDGVHHRTRAIAQEDNRFGAELAAELRDGLTYLDVSLECKVGS